MVTGFNHSGFVVSDMDAMVRFYRDALGLEVVREVDSVVTEHGVVPDGSLFQELRAPQNVGDPE